tara:strand:- start:1137 stop:1979 length:843 start_codon:yes stop_codon:yes gene_type:complete
MVDRNRSQGWTHAKISGHENEKNILQLLKSDAEFKENLEEFFNTPMKEFNIGGLNEKSVNSVFDKSLTKSKTDLKIISENKTLKFSIKKSRGGQVYLISIPRFIYGIKKQFNLDLNASELKAIKLFFGEDGEEVNKIIKSKKTMMINEKIKSYERRKLRLTIKSIESYDEGLAKSLLNFFRKNCREIFLFCFSRGLAIEESDWAEYLWYINTIKDDNDAKLNKIFEIKRLASNIKNSDDLEFGTRNGGTTIQLPFGFVQWHQGQIQFHHNYKKICSLCIK